MQSKAAEIGDFVAGGAPIAQIQTDDQMEVSITIRETDAALIPELFTGNQGPATVSIDFSGATKIWTGKIIRVDPALDRQTRTLTATVALQDRQESEAEFAAGAPPASINAFARVIVEGIDTANTYTIPSTASSSGNAVWLLRDDRFVFHPAERVHVDGETSDIKITELLPEDRLVLTNLAAPQERQVLRDVTQNAAQTTLKSE